MKRTRTRRMMWVTAVALAGTTTLAACGGSEESGASDGESSSESAGGTDPDAFTVLSANENPTLEAVLDSLASGPCEAQNEALPLEHEKVAQADTVQRVTLLASQGAMPPHTIAGTALVRPDGDLGSNGLVQDLQSSMEASGAWENVLPAAASTEDNVYDGFVSMPYQYNIEGIWFNRQIFAENGLQEPTTWEELTTTADALQQADVIPMTTAGADAWPVTRLLGNYIFRTVGPDAMQAIADGEASLTDEAYVEAAQALADFGDAGYFGEGFSTRDGNASSNLFLTGEAAMVYDGSWFLTQINDPDSNQIGAENIGFMPFPSVDGGAGSLEQYPANAGAPMVFNAETYGPKIDDWVTCIAENYGAQSMSDAGVISGFTINDDVTDVPPATSQIQERITEIEETVLWFEALFDPKSNSLAQTNITLLTTGQMSPEDYMQDLQASIDDNS